MIRTLPQVQSNLPCLSSEPLLAGFPGEAKFAGFTTLDNAGITLSIAAKRRTFNDPLGREFGGSIFSYVEHHALLFGVTLPVAGGKTYCADGKIITVGVISKSAEIPRGTFFLGSYHSHRTHASFSDALVNGLRLGDIPGLLAASQKADRPFTLFLGRSSQLGGMSSSITVESITSLRRQGVWSIKHRILHTT